MRTLSSTTARLQNVATEPTWRLERHAALQLEALSDRELHDMGLRRCEIEGAVKGGLNRERAFSRHY